MLTMAFAQIVWSIAFQWVKVTGGDNGLLGIWPQEPFASPSTFYWLVLALAACGLAALRMLVFSPFGYALRAARDSTLRAESIGIDRMRVQWVSFMLSGLFAGLAGALYAFFKGSVFPDNLAIPLSVDGLVAVLLGGVGSVSGAIVGAGFLKSLSIWLVSHTDYSKLVLGAIIVALVVVFPGGVMGLFDKLRERRAAAQEVRP
jgi:branched-chain amino acid transport system permease protein